MHIFIKSGRKRCFGSPLSNVTLFFILVMGFMTAQYCIIEYTNLRLFIEYVYKSVLGIQSSLIRNSIVGEGALFCSVLLTFYALRHSTDSPKNVWQSLSKNNSIPMLTGGIAVSLLLIVSQVMLLVMCKLYFFVHVAYDNQFPIYVAVAYTFFVATSEELIFRGYVFQTLESYYGTSKTILSATVLFALVHLLNWKPAFSMGDTAMTVLVPFAGGLLFAFAYVATRNLWVAIGLHWSWDFFHAAVFGTPTINPVGIITLNPALVNRMSGFWHTIDITSVLFYIVAALIYSFVARRRSNWLRQPVALTGPQAASAS